MPIEYIPDHVERGLARLISQYKEKPLFRAWVASYLKPIQDIEDALWEVLTERGVDNGVGVQLDVVGKIVNRSRGGLGDDDYRIALRCEIRIQRSDGTSRDVIEVTNLALPPGYSYLGPIDVGPATIRFTINQPVLFDPQVLFRALTRTKAAGVKLLFEFMRSPDPDDYFVWQADDTPTDVGFGDSNTPSMGGLLECVLGG